ncbi:MAG: hypothetical protein ACPG4N_12490, partial [Gammaproteobacteria bacterium]
LFVTTALNESPELMQAVERANTEYGMDAQLADYQRGFFSSEGRIAVNSGGMNGDIGLDIRHGPVLSSGSALIWAEVSASLPGGLWWPGLARTVDQSPLPKLLPGLSPAQRRELPPINLVAEALWNGDLQARWTMPGFADKPSAPASPASNQISWVAASARVELRENTEGDNAPLAAWLEIQAPALSHPTIGRMAADAMRIEIRLDPSLDDMAPHTIGLTVNGGEWLRGGSRIYLGEFSISQSLREQNWARELRASVANGSLEPFIDGPEVTRVSSEIDLGLSGVTPEQWRYLLQALFNHGLDDSLWSDMATGSIELDVRQADLILDGAIGSVTGQLKLEPPGEDYAMIYEKLSGGLTLSFSRWVVSTLARYRVAPYFTPLLQVKQPKATVNEREWFLERELNEMTEAGLLTQLSPGQFQTDLKMDGASLSVNGSIVTRWDQ